MTFDVEEWFQVENFKPWIPFSSWSQLESRVDYATRLILDLLDASAEATTQQKLRATFFTLGWVAERHPDLVREIQQRGHEVASHGYGHLLTSQQDRTQMVADIAASKHLLEDVLGTEIAGYRAPSFSVSAVLLDVLRELRFRYDSSYNSFAWNSRYGRLNLDRAARRGVVVEVGEGLHELPISNWRLAGRTLPWGGGGYFRLIPAPLLHLGVRNILQAEGVYVLYLHPWEFDPGQPRVNTAGRFYRLRHYLNLHRTAAKLRSFLDTFSECQFLTCARYLNHLGLEAPIRPSPSIGPPERDGTAP